MSGAAAASTTVHNSQPEFEEDWGLSYELDTNDDLTSATVFGTFSDFGTMDFHRVSIEWGDGVFGDGTTDPVELPPGDSAIEVTRTFVSGLGSLVADLFPIVVTLWDDDGQPVEVTIVTCGCGCGDASEGGSETIDPSPPAGAPQPAGDEEANDEPDPPSTINDDGDVVWTHIENSKTKTNKSVRVQAIVGAFGKTKVGAKGAKLELLFNTTTCLLSIKHLQIPMTMEIAETASGVNLAETEIAATVAHETIHLNAQLKHQKKLENLATAFVNTFNALPQNVRSAKGRFVVSKLNYNITNYLKSLATVEGRRQVYHLDHLTEETRQIVAGAVVVGPTTFEDKLDKPAFIADINQVYSQSLTTFDDARDFLNTRIKYWSDLMIFRFTNIERLIKP